MKTIRNIVLLALSLLSVGIGQVSAQGKASPAATATETLGSGAKITISYSSPSLKGREIGKDVEPMEGQIWRAGANNATVFETDKDVTIEGKTLAAGKYAFFTIKTGDQWTLIFNKKWDQWGAYSYAETKGEDALQVTVKGKKTATASESLSYKIDKSGKVSLLWGDLDVSFNVK